MPTNTNNYTVLSYNVAYLMGVVAKLNKRAKRLGVALLVVTVLGRRVVKSTGPGGSERKISVTDITVEGEEIKLNGWQLAGVLEHTDGGVLLRAALENFDLSAYRDADPKDCDHCHTRRNRKDSFVLLHEDGRQVRVGRTCLKDYLGHGSISAIVWRADAEIALAGCMDSEEFLGGGAADGAPLDEYLGWVSLSMRQSGWMSRTAAKESLVQSTADEALDRLYAPEIDRRGNVKDHPTAADFARADKALAWVAADLEKVASSYGLNDYQHNLSVILKGNGYCTSRQAGFAASILSYYDRGIAREIERRERAKATKDSTHVGEIKDRLTLQDATVTRINCFDGFYGTTFIIGFLHAGNVFTWFASKAQDIEVGDVVNVTGTVKKHDNYKGTAQTVLTRCRIKAA
jgi:hypothetical protein